METQYGPRGLHAELESALERLVAQRRRTRRSRRAGGGQGR